MKTLQKSKLISIPIIFLLSLVSTFAQIRPNRFTTNGDPGAWVYIPLPALTAYANNTNYNIDWTTNAYRLQGTGDVWFQYSTNWGLPGTNRFTSVYFPPTNIYRHVYFSNAATNWHAQARPVAGIPTGYGATLRLSAYGSGETNVVYVPDIDMKPTGTNWQGQFSPNSVGGLALWWEASQQTAEDEFGVTPITYSGQLVRSITDLSGNSGRATNANQINQTGLCYLFPNDAPFNVPCLHFPTAVASYLVTSNFTAWTQPNYCFVMFLGRGTGFPLLDGLSEGNRFAIQPTENPLVNTALYSGTSLGAPGSSKQEWRLFTFLQNSTSSLIRTNGVQAVSGNGGTQTPNRWAFGTDYNLSGIIGNCHVAELLVYHGTLTAANLTNIEAYLWNKYGTPHP